MGTVLWCKYIIGSNKHVINVLKNTARHAWKMPQTQPSHPTPWGRAVSTAADFAFPLKLNPKPKPYENRIYTIAPAQTINLNPEPKP